MIVSEKELGAMSSLALAHMGDAVYELLVRTMLCRAGGLTAGSLHRETIRHVAAPAQAKAAAKVLPLLTDEESAVFRRARNAHGHQAPRGASPGEYHSASALEALFGWLYLREENERIRELFSAIMEDNDAAGRDRTDGAAP